MMNAIGALQIPISSIVDPKFPFLNRKRKLSITFCNSNYREEPKSNPSDGDKRRQEILAKIAMLQTQKIRLTDYLDEKSAHLTQFVEEANAEFNQIGESALQELEEASARIMENLDQQMQTFEESAELNRREIEMEEKELAEFEEQMVKDRNEGMFFKNLGQNPQKTPEKAREEVQKIKKVTKQNAGSKIRRNVYVAFIILLVIALGDTLITSPELKLQKVIGLVFILLALIAQFSYEQGISSETEDVEEDKEE